MSIDFHPTAPRPVEETEPLRDSRETNPMFNDNKMKLGLFGTNCSYGLVMSHAPSTYEVSWAHTKEIAQRADALGFEALVPIARWKGFGGTTNFKGNCFETYTWAAGLAEATENIAIFATSHLPTVHPIVAAKMATTIDRISGGRFGLNLVMGWVTPELAMFGEQRQQEDRYAFGQEWIDYVLQLTGPPLALSAAPVVADAPEVPLGYRPDKPTRTRRPPLEMRDLVVTWVARTVDKG
jgi:FMNH2-dependent dimethyl sulfone monooxygenase